MVEDPRFVIENEFAAVEVRRDDSGNAARLCLFDLRTGRAASFDALFLESVIWSSPDQQNVLMDPAARWAADRTGTPFGEGTTRNGLVEDRPSFESHLGMR